MRRHEYMDPTHTALTAALRDSAHGSSGGIYTRHADGHWTWTSGPRADGSIPGPTRGGALHYDLAGALAAGMPRGVTRSALPWLPHGRTLVGIQQARRDARSQPPVTALKSRWLSQIDTVREGARGNLLASSSANVRMGVELAHAPEVTLRDRDSGRYSRQCTYHRIERWLTIRITRSAMAWHRRGRGILDGALVVDVHPLSTGSGYRARVVRRGRGYDYRIESVYTTLDRRAVRADQVLDAREIRKYRSAAQLALCAYDYLCGEDTSRYTMRVLRQVRSMVVPTAAERLLAVDEATEPPDSPPPPQLTSGLRTIYAIIAMEEDLTE